MQLLTEQDVRGRLAAAVSAAGGRVAFARINGVSLQYVHDAIAGRRTLGPAILRALGVERVVMYREIEKPDAPTA